MSSLGAKSAVAAIAGVILLALGVYGVRVVRKRPARAPAALDIILTQAADSTDIERYATVPIEVSLAGSPSFTSVTSTTTNEGAQVRVMLAPAVDSTRARMEAADRLANVLLPEDYRKPRIEEANGPTLTFALVPDAGTSLVSLRTVEDREVERALETIPGVVAIHACGGRQRRIEVRLDAAKLTALGVAATDVDTALATSHAPRGDTNGAAPASGSDTLDELRARAIVTRTGATVRLRDVALVEDGFAPPTCTAIREDGAELVVGEIALRRDADIGAAASAVTARLADLHASAKVHAEPLDMNRGEPWLDVRVDLAEPEPHDTTIIGLATAVRSVPHVKSVFTRRRGDALSMLAAVDGDPSETAAEIARSLEKIQGARYDITSPQTSLPTHLRGARARLSSPDLEGLRRASAALTVALARVPGITGVMAKDARMTRRLLVQPDRRALERLSVSQEDLFKAVHAGFEHTATTLLERDGSVDVVMVPQAPLPTALMTLSARDASGNAVPLSMLVHTEEAPNPVSIHRANGTRYLDVLMNAHDDQTLEAARTALSTQPLPPDMTLTLTREDTP